MDPVKYYEYRGMGLPVLTTRFGQMASRTRADGVYTIVVVTHNMQQAGRVANFTAFFYLGELVEYGRTDVVFTRPKDRRTEDYITGRMG